MLMVAIFFVSAVLSFALSLVAADILGPSSFGRYAVGLSIAVIVNTTLFEWLRLSATRFYSTRASADQPAIRHTLDRAYLVTSVALAAVTALAVAPGFDLGVSGALLAAAAAAGLSIGLFDYQAALARARFDNRGYAALVLLRGLGGFGLAAGAAFWFAEPGAVLLASALAALVAILVMRSRLVDAPSRVAPGSGRETVRLFARYAVPLVAATAIYQCLPLVNRTMLAARSGFAEAGYFSLASEIGTRLFQNVGTALDLALFQIAVRADELHGRDEAERQIGRNVGLVVAIVWPCSAGLWLVWPSFEAVFVPAQFRGHVEPAMTLLIPALAASSLVQFALNPVFQLRRRTGPVVLAAIAALAVNAALVFAWPGLARPQEFAAAQVAGFGAGLLVLVGLALRAGARLPWRDLGVATLAAGAMSAALWPWRLLHPGLPMLALQALAGAVVYSALALAFDLAGSRTRVCAALARRGAIRSVR